MIITQVMLRKASSGSNMSKRALNCVRCYWYTRKCLISFFSFLGFCDSRKKINSKPEKIQKTLWKKWKKACFSLCIKHILKEKTKNENKENISINWRIKQPKERKKKTILHVKRKKNYRIKKKSSLEWLEFYQTFVSTYNILFHD